MILISSIEEDYSTNEVIDWLLYDNKEVVRVNSISRITDVNIKFNEGSFKFDFKMDNRGYCLNNISAYWFRRGDFDFDGVVSKNDIELFAIKQSVYAHLLNEELNSEELNEIRGGHRTGNEGTGWLASVSGDCSRSGNSCWTVIGMAEWMTGN